MSYLAIELVGKRIELLKEWLPQIQRIAVLARPQHPGEHLERQASEAVVGKLGMEFSYFPYYSQSVLPARDLGELETTFRAFALRLAQTHLPQRITMVVPFAPGADRVRLKVQYNVT
jgi:hypothetical protein